MASAPLDSCKAYASGAGYAHPSELTDTSLSSRDQSLSELRALISKVPFDMVLRGLPSDRISQSPAHISPRVRRSPLAAGTVQHLDIVSCWKGMSCIQSRELTMWEGFLKESLASLIKERLLLDLADKLSGYPTPTDESLIIPRMVEFFSGKQPFVSEVSIPDLVDDILSRLYATQRTEDTYRDFEWSLSSGNLPKFVFNFIRTQDCFLHAVGGTLVMFDLSNAHTSSGLSVFADIHWQLPRTTFSALPTRLAKGEMYRITPQFADASLDCAGYFSQANDEVEYTITKSAISLQWDPARECFYGRVPCPSQIPSQAIETSFSVKVLTLFPHNVRYERVSRYDIRLEVGDDEHKGTGTLHSVLASLHDSPASSLRNHEPRWVPCYTNTPQSKTQFGTPHSPPYYMEDFAQQDFLTNATSQDRLYVSDTAKRHYSPSDDALASASLCKRKTAAITDMDTLSPLGNADQSCLESCAKRRRLSHSSDPASLEAAEPKALFAREIDESAMLARVQCMTAGVMGKARSSLKLGTTPFWQKLEEGPAWVARSYALHKSHFKDPPWVAISYADTKPHSALPGDEQVSLTWRDGQLHSVGSTVSYDSAESSPLDGGISVPVIASAAKSASTETPSQMQIQHNYQEFEERKKKKAEERAYYTATVPGFDGIVSPTDAENKTFEEIFMEDDDADDWMSDAGAGSEETGSIIMEE